MSKTAVFTIASKNYIAYARTLLESVDKFHPELDRYLLLVDEPDAMLDLSRENYSIVLAKDINIDHFQLMAFKYDIMELNTAVKPFFMIYLLRQGYDKVIYFDPDIMLFSKMDIILESLADYSIVLTPHITKPIEQTDKCIPGERDFLSTGTYNLGFIAVSGCKETESFLEWWSERCEHECYSEAETGYFVDQKWINLVPGLYSAVKILRDPGCNMAYWNLHERYLNGGNVNGAYPLVFFHFSGIDPVQEGQLSKYQNRYSLEDREDLKSIFQLYRNNILENGYLETMNLPYVYACYDNGDRIGPLARRMYSVVLADITGSPFATGPGTYHNLLKDKHLLEKGCSVKYTKNNTLSIKNKLDTILTILAKFMGPDKYYALMKYLRYVSVLRKQNFIFNNFLSR